VAWSKIGFEFTNPDGTPLHPAAVTYTFKQIACLTGLPPIRPLSDVPDHGEMTVRPPPGVPLPDLVHVANRVLTEEAEALRAALEDFSNAPQPGCPWRQDDKAVSDLTSPEAQGRAKLLRYTRHQAMLISVNAYDHLLTLGRVLGSDGAMPPVRSREHFEGHM
jgi:hypothetical protein